MAIPWLYHCWKIRQTLPPAEKISYAEGKLEYKFANALNVLGKPDDPHVAYVIGNGEEIGLSTWRLLYAISSRYHVDTIDLSRSLDIPLVYDAIIINQPTIPFTGPEKLKIDQFVMHGGHVLWALNTLNANLDSLQGGQLVAMDRNLDIDDVLFKYGVRVNKDLVEDVQCLKLPRVVNGANRT